MKTFLNVLDSIAHLLSNILQFLFLVIFGILFFHIAYVCGVVVTASKEGYKQAKYTTNEVMNDV